MRLFLTRLLRGLFDILSIVVFMWLALALYCLFYNQETIVVVEVFVAVSLCYIGVALAAVDFLKR